MKEKKKVTLEAIRVQSFVTSLNDDEKNKIYGGTDSNEPTTPADSCVPFEQSTKC